MRAGSSGKHRQSSLEASLVNPLTHTSGTWAWSRPFTSSKPIAQTFAASAHSKILFLINIPVKTPFRVVSCSQSQTRAQGIEPSSPWVFLQRTQVDIWGAITACKAGHLALWRTCHPTHTWCSGALVAAPKLRDWLCSYQDKILPLLVLRSPWL